MSIVASRRLAAICVLLAILVAGNQPTLARNIDPHGLYEQRCSGCHSAHAGQFVHDKLERLDEEIVGRGTGRELRSFLTAGHGNLAPPEIDAMVAHLAAILERGALFREKCLICHGRAVTLARSELILRDGRLVGRYSGRDIAAFLQNHGRLELAQIPTIVEMFERQLSTESGD